MQDEEEVEYLVTLQVSVCLEAMPTLAEALRLFFELLPECPGYLQSASIQLEDELYQATTREECRTLEKLAGKGAADLAEALRRLEQRHQQREAP
jgi:hypothetical protein